MRICRKNMNEGKIMCTHAKMYTHAKSCVRTQIFRPCGMEGDSLIIHLIKNSYPMSHFNIWYPGIPKGTLGT